MTSITRTSPLVPLVLLAVVGSALAGCSAGGTASADATGSKPASSGSASSSASAPATSATSASDAADICTWVSVSAAQSALHLSPALTDQESGTFVDGEPECGFTTDDHSVIINVTVFDAATNPFNPDTPIMGADTFHTISGVGDRAAVGSFELDAAVGTKVLVVENFTDDSAVAPDQLVAMAKLFVPHIH
jgi:hypothetical protein